MSKDFQQQVDEAINLGKSFPGVIYNVVMGALVLIVCINFIIETYPLPFQTREVLEGIDIIITFIFLGDYLLRFWAKDYSIRYLFTPMAIIDLISILPLFVSARFQFIRILRLFRVLRLLRIFEKGSILSVKISELHLRQIRIFFSLFCIVFISAGMMYELEFRHRRDEMFTFFDSLYYVLVSLATVGYGDIVPITPTGRLVALGMIISGIVIIPWQISGIAKYVIETRDKIVNHCEKCGCNLHDEDATHCKKCGTKLY